MSLGILNNVSAIYAENNLNNTQSSLQTVLQQLSSGARINSGADDAAGLAIANGLKANESALTQSAQNASDGIGLLSTADGALSQVTNLLDRAVTLATEAANSTLSTAQVSSANQEYQSIISEIGLIGGTTNFNGNNVFSTSGTAFYVGDGTATGSAVYNDVVGSLTTSSVGQTAGVVAALGTVGLTGTGTAAVGITVANASDTISGTLNLVNTSHAQASTALSITFNPGTTLAQAAAQINAQPGVTYHATFTAGSNALAIAPIAVAPSTAADLVTITATNLNDYQGNTTYTGSTATATTQALATNTVSGGSVGNHASITAATLISATDTLSGTLSLSTTGTGVANSSVSLQLATGTTLAKAVSTINSNTSFSAAGYSAAAVGNALVLTGPAATAASAYTLSLAGSNFTDAPAAAAAGAGVDFTNNNISTLTTGTAQNVLTAVNSAIQNISYQRGILGADSNQLTAAANTAASENVNLTSAESSIRSTNYGQATSDLAKFEVLSQTGISALAQANSVQQEILKLLQ